MMANQTPDSFSRNTLWQYLQGVDVAIERAMIMTLKGSSQQWYASLPKGSIRSWEQLQQRIENNFQGYSLHSDKPDV
jgi:hypothetical protein